MDVYIISLVEVNTSISYVDDILLTTNDIDSLCDIKKFV